MIVIDVEQRTQAWAEERRGLATASCFADILSKPRSGGGESSGRRNLRIKLALERLTGVRAPSWQSFAMKQGTEREPLAKLAYEIETGEIVESCGFIRHATLESGGSPDGLIGSDGGIEIKAPEPTAHLEALRSGRVPSMYVAQVQGYLWLSQRRWWRFVSYSPDFPERLQLVIVDVQRDQAYIDRLSAEVTVFCEEVRAEVAELKALEARRP